MAILRAEIKGTICAFICALEKNGKEDGNPFRHDADMRKSCVEQLVKYMDILKEMQSEAALIYTDVHCDVDGRDKDIFADTAKRAKAEYQTIAKILQDLGVSDAIKESDTGLTGTQRRKKKEDARESRKMELCILARLQLKQDKEGLFQGNKEQLLADCTEQLARGVHTLKTMQVHYAMRFTEAHCALEQASDQAPASGCKTSQEDTEKKAMTAMTEYRQLHEILHDSEVIRESENNGLRQA